MHMCEQWQLHCTSQWGQQMPLSEHVYCVAVTFKMTERVEQRICIKFWVKLEHFSIETIHMVQKAAAMGNWWVAASSQQHTRSWITSHADFFLWNIKSPNDSAPLQPRFGTLRLLAFPKTITFERGEISDCWWDSGKYDGATDGDWENYVRTQGASVKGAEASLSCVQCFILSSSVDVSIFHITWLGSFWTDLVNAHSAFKSFKC